MSSATTETMPRAPRDPGPDDRRGAARLWARVGLVVALLAASAAARSWQATRVDAVRRSGRISPFPLAEVPMRLGPWRGEDMPSDPLIVRATGATDHAFRSYTDDRTGVRIDVILLYGPAADVYIHAPENCYPAAGYTQVGDTDSRPIRIDDHQVPFRALTYTRGGGDHANRQRVYYTWRYNDRWTPEMVAQKRFERIPGMYKVHLARPVAELELLDGPDPCEDLLRRLIPDLERRIARAAAARAD